MSKFDLSKFLIEAGVSLVFSLSTLFVSTYPGPSNADTDPLVAEEILEHARRIITSEKDDVRLWAHPPRMLVFGNATVHAQVQNIVNDIEQAVAPRFGERLFSEIRFGELPAQFAVGQQRLWMRLRRGGPSGRQVSLNFGSNHESYETDIVVVVGSRTEVALVNGLWGMPTKFNRAMLEGGRERCFYQALSKNGVRFGALVSIFPDGTPEQLDECLWEEILHALGPLQDVEGSPHFSFDDQASVYLELLPSQRRQLDARKRANDLLLIRSLYESGTMPGDPPDQAIEYLKRLLSGH